MEGGIEQVIAQWGAFGVILVAVGLFAWTQYRDARKQNEKLIEITKQHSDALADVQVKNAAARADLAKQHMDEMTKLRVSHAEALASLQTERVRDAQNVTTQLMGLQREFNATTSEMTEAIGAFKGGLESMRTSVEHMGKIVEAALRR
ncbi:MAG: hypothetical protein HC882_06085 [Acidobacteria bacterium]|nr:hypothetical protein [Acidobacteriota bacterium]